MQIKQLTPEDIPLVIDLHSSYLNYGPGVTSYIKNIFDKKEYTGFQCITNDEDVAGIILYSKGISLLGDHALIQKKVSELAGKRVVYTGDAVVIKQEYQDQGISRLLHQAIIDELKKRGVELVLLELWVHPDGSIPAKNVIHYFKGYTFVGFYKNFYQFFFQDGFFCPICGEICHCGAKLYLCSI